MTETVYPKQIQPVLIEGADAMDRIFPAAEAIVTQHTERAPAKIASDL